MKRLALALFALSLPLAAQAPGADSKVAKVERLLSMTGVDSQSDKMMDQVYKMASNMFPSDAPPEVRAKVEEMQAKVFALIRQRMGWQQLKPHYVKMYTEVYSDEELDGMIAFFESPAGRSMIAKTPLLMQRSMEMTQSLMAEIMPEIKRISAEALPK